MFIVTPIIIDVDHESSDILSTSLSRRSIILRIAIEEPLRMIVEDAGFEDSFL